MIILHTHLWYFQGGSKMILEIAKRINKREPVQLVINNGSQEYISKFTEENIDVINLNRTSTNSLLYWIFFPISILLDYIKILHAYPHTRKEKILTTTFPSHFLGFLLSKRNKSDYYCYCFEPFPFFYSKEFILSSGIKSFFYFILGFLYSWVDKISITNARAVFTLNETTQKIIKSTYGINPMITLMGVDTNHFKRTLRPEISRTYDRYQVILHSTDYSKMKKTDLAIKTLSEVKKKIPNVKLLITSTRPDSKEKIYYLKLADNLSVSENIDFLNFVSYQDLPVYYSLAKCYLSCSYDETLGTTSSNLPVKESLACETPAVRANITSEDVEDGVSGYLVNPKEIKVVADKIIRLMSLSDREARAMGISGRKKIIKLYTWENVADIISKGMGID